MHILNKYRRIKSPSMLTVNTTHLPAIMDISTFIPEAVRTFCFMLLLLGYLLLQERKIDFFLHICSISRRGGGKVLN